MTSIDPKRVPILQKQREIENLDAERARVNAEMDMRRAILVAQLQSLEEYAGMFADMDIAPSVAIQITDERIKKRIAIGRGKRPPSSKSKPGRGISPKWKRILAEVVAANQKEFTAAEVTRIAQGIGFPVRDNTVRTQLVAYTGGGHLERLANGKYRATKVLARELEMELGQHVTPELSLKLLEGMSEKDKKDLGATLFPSAQVRK